MSKTGILSIALDLGSTAIKTAALNENGELTHIVSRPAPVIEEHLGHLEKPSRAAGMQEAPQRTPQTYQIDRQGVSEDATQQSSRAVGFSRCPRYESDALAYAQIAERVLGECRDHAELCVTLGLCSQRSSFLLWDNATGQPVTPLISWQDGRGAESCDALREHENAIRALSGLPLTPYYFAPKLRVLLQQNPHWRAHLMQGRWRAGTLDTFLIWRWSNGRHFVTDASMAARTQLLDIAKTQWSPALCELFDIPAAILPKVLASSQLNLHLDNGLVLQASIGDQSAALIAGVQAGSAEALANLGTGCFVVRYVAHGETHHGGYLNTLVYRDARTHLADEGTLNSIAAALALYPVAQCEFQDLARHDVFCLAEPSGLGAPYFKNNLGLQFSQSVAHLSQQDIAALLLEAVIFRVARILEDLHRERPLARVYLSGGLANLSSLQLGIAQCAPCEVYRLDQSESSLLGAAMLAANLQPGSLRDVHKITVTIENQKLVGKFQRWKIWLDELLRQT
ncbi:MAG: carbohydrate kinase [Gallionella sp.]|nr:carbohydrate kinase [Gallionella sp.]